MVIDYQGSPKMSMEELRNLYQFRVLKKWRHRFYLGPGGRPERAGSIGRVSPCLQGSKLVSSGGGGGYFSRPIHGEISAL